jgi:hypothetical protein
MTKGGEARRQLGEYLFHRRLVAVAAARNTVTPWVRGWRRAGGEQDPLFPIPLLSLCFFCGFPAPLVGPRLLAHEKRLTDAGLSWASGGLSAQHACGKAHRACVSIWIFYIFSHYYVKINGPPEILQIIHLPMWPTAAGTNRRAARR